METMIYFLSFKQIDHRKHQGIWGSWPKNLILRDSVSTNLKKQQLKTA